MNEKQKLESGQVNPSDKKSEKDYSKYFEAVYIPPSLKDAKKRGKEAVTYHNDFKISEQFKGLGDGRKFYIRTYGCQMNEHDTEVMAGIFMALGYEATNSVDDANVILLNTCAIRENAENKVFGELGHLKALKKQSRSNFRRVRLYVPRGISREPYFEKTSVCRYDFRNA